MIAEILQLRQAMLKEGMSRAPRGTVKVVVKRQRYFPIRTRTMLVFESGTQSRIWL